MQIIVDADSRRLSLGPTPPVRGETIPGTLTFMKGGVPFRLPAGTAIQIGLKSWNDPSDVVLAYTTATRPEPDGAPYTFSLSLNTVQMLAKFTAGVTRYDCSIEVKWEVSAGSGTFKKTQRRKYSVDADTLRDTDANPSTMLSRNDFLVTNGTGLLVNVAAGYAANGAFVAAQASLAITNATNYIEVTAAGVASVNTTAFSAGSYPLATVVASAGAITANTDLRAWITPKPGAAGGSLTVGTSAITGGTSGRILYDNAGVLGELPVGTGVATALAVNVGSAGAFLTSAVTSITGTANEITVTGTTTPTLSLPSALTFTSKTVTGGTFNSGAFNGTVGATTPDTVAGTTGTFDSTVTVGANSQAGTLNITNSSGTTTASINGSDGSASFGSGELTIDQFGNLNSASNLIAAYEVTVGANGNAGTLNVKNSGGTTTASIAGADGFASFANGAITIGANTGTAIWLDDDGTALFGSVTTDSLNATNSVDVATGAITLGTNTGTAAWIHSNGSASFGSGSCTIDQYGYASFASGTFTATTSLLLGTAGSAVGTIGFNNATSGTTTLEPATGALGTGTVTLPLTGTLATLAGTETLTNKRITQRSGTATSSATPTINTDNVDFYSLTAQAADITSFTTNLSGTPTEGQTLWIAITGTAARAITWGATFEAGAVALPTTTVSTDRLDVAFVWNTVSLKWRCMASG